MDEVTEESSLGRVITLTDKRDKTLSVRMRNDIIDMLQKNPDKLIHSMSMYNAICRSISSSSYEAIYTVCEFSYVCCSDITHKVKVFSDSIENIDALNNEVTLFCNTLHRKVDNLRAERSESFVTVILEYTDYIFNSSEKSLLQIDVVSKLSSFNLDEEYIKSIYLTDKYFTDSAIIK